MGYVICSKNKDICNILFPYLLWVWFELLQPEILSTEGSHIRNIIAIDWERKKDPLPHQVFQEIQLESHFC